MYKNTSKMTFQFLLSCLKVDKSKKRMHWKDFRDPNDQRVQLILYLYSMEPPFYADLNNASRILDSTKIKSLGPFSRALWGILASGDKLDNKR